MWLEQPRPAKISQRRQHALFVRRDEVEAQWDYIDHIRALWAENQTQPKTYAAGTWGPAASTALPGREGFHWHEEL